jgi:hypothetical protein
LTPAEAVIVSCPGSRAVYVNDACPPEFVLTSLVWGLAPVTVKYTGMFADAVA